MEDLPIYQVAFQRRYFRHFACKGGIYTIPGKNSQRVRGQANCLITPAHMIISTSSMPLEG